MSFLEGIIYILWRGFAIGVIISAPMGPVGILCVQRTLEKGRKTGFYTGVGAAISDLFYCLVTGFGLSLIEDFLKANQDVIQIVGSVVMAVFGVYLFRSNPSRKLKKPESAPTSAAKRDIMRGFLFTFSNPLIIFLIIGLFARFNFLLPEISFAQYVTGYLFIILGALCWWWVVSYFVDKVRSHFNLRSMWLINKITGSIIMIFALVGVVTAVTNIASAARPSAVSLNTPSAVYLNSERGMGKWDNDGKSNFIAAPAGDFVFSLRATAGACKPYSWGLVLKNEERKVSFMFHKEYDKYNELYPALLKVRAYVTDGHDANDTGNAEAVAENSVVLAGPEDSPVSLRLIGYSDFYCTLSGGDRSYDMLANLPVPGFMPDSIGLICEDASKVSADFISLEGKKTVNGALCNPAYDFGDEDVRATYFARSADELEGCWEIFDRSLEDSRLRMGGDYRLAIVSAADGYAIYYIDGAVKNPDAWRSGDIKGSLHPLSHKNIYDVNWYDPAGERIEGEIKAQFSTPDLLVLQFVDHSSTLRLRKVPALNSGLTTENHDF